MPDPQKRPRPLNNHERTMMVLKPEDNIVQQELELDGVGPVDNRPLTD